VKERISSVARMQVEHRSSPFTSPEGEKAN
jgi:hypothetical protein